MPAALFSDLEPSLSRPRLARYRVDPSDPHELILAHYLWNIDLSRALYPSLNAFEIALRNNVSRHLTEDFGPYWYNTRAFKDWLYRTDEYDGYAPVKKAIKNLKGRRKPVNSDNVVAELTLGFWASLFWGHYDTYWSQRKRVVTLLPGAEPADRGLPGLRKKIGAVHRLRNRAFHHEPIFRDTRLAEKHAHARALAKWLNPRVDCVLEELDHFATVHSAPITDYVDRVKDAAART